MNAREKLTLGFANHQMMSSLKISNQKLEKKMIRKHA